MKNILYTILSIFLSLSIYAQKITISGNITDLETNENLIGAYIYTKNKQYATVSNTGGFYSLTVKKSETVIITASFVGYKSLVKRFEAKNDTIINWQMKPANELDEITVTAAGNIHLKPEVSKLSIPKKTIRIMPTISGETDIMKVYQLMPGVQSGQEGSSALYVRGGGHDQNLFMIDGIPLYYVNHLGGNISVFDDNAINTVSLLKGGFPAQYGGRLSSAVDIRMKDGNTEKIGGEVKVGLLTSKCFIEGPLNKGKTSIMLSARRSNIDLATRAITGIVFKGYTFAYTFYDVFGKIRHKFSDKNSIYLIAYSGRDRFMFRHTQKELIKEELSDNINKYFYHSHLFTKWGNQLAGLRWSFIPAKKVYGNLSISYSNFFYNNEQEYTKNDSIDEQTIENYLREYNSGIRDLTAKLDFDLFPTSNYGLKFGANFIYHTFSPGVSRYTKLYDSVREDTLIGNSAAHTHEMNMYLENKLKIGKKFSSNIGIRANYYHASQNDFYSVQPRIVLNYIPRKNSSIKAAYSYIEQYLHLVSNSGTGIPTDTWLPPNKALPPQNSHQYILNVSYTEPKTMLTLTTEGFYKEMDNLVDFKEGASYEMSDLGIYNIIEAGGFGKAYGLEFLVQKKQGKTTGWIAYTLSKNIRKFENINNGHYFPATFDRRHDLAVVVNHKLTKHLSISTNWVYTSGNMMTLAKSVYTAHFLNPTVYVDYADSPGEQIQGSTGLTAYYYGGRNNYRLPAYHRLDLNLVYNKVKTHGVATWQIGVYNAYSQKNIFFLYHKNEGKDLYKFTLFPLIPSFSYSFKF